MSLDLFHEISEVSPEDCQDLLQAVVNYFREERTLPWHGWYSLSKQVPKPESVSWVISENPFLYLDLSPSRMHSGRVFLLQAQTTCYHVDKSSTIASVQRYPGLDVHVVAKFPQGLPGDCIRLPGGKYAIRTGIYELYGGPTYRIISDGIEYALQGPGACVKGAR